MVSEAHYRDHGYDGNQAGCQQKQNNFNGQTSPVIGYEDMKRSKKIPTLKLK